MQIKSYEGAVKYLESFIGKVRYRIDKEFLKHHDPLERMRVLLSLLGNPLDKFKSVLVGGTSGKGSTAYLISHILTTAGYKTGLTISPHLQRINERIQVNGKPISDQKFTDLLDSILSSIEGMKEMKVGAPSYFEILIAMAFLYFAEQKVDITVVEVGMGGEFDATNTLHPLVAVLTNVSLDHTNVLGGTAQKIARTKAGIIKKIEDLRFKIHELSKNRKSSIINHKSIVITGAKQPSVIKIVEDRCKEANAEMFRLGKDFDFNIKEESLEGSVFDVTSAHGREWKLNDLRLSLLGKYQVENASLAIETVLQLGKFACLPAGRDFKVSEAHIREALKTAFFPGRFEVVRFKGSPRPLNDSSTSDVTQSSNVARQHSSQTQTSKDLFKSSFRGGARPRNYTLDAKRYTLILDGAHNPTKMKAFLTTLNKLYPRHNKIFIVAFKFDKDVKKMLKQILQVADILIITEFRAKTDVSTNASIDTKRIEEDIKRLGYYGIKKIIMEHDSRKVLNRALNISVSQYPNIDSIIVVTGSLYLVGEARDYVMINPKS